MLLPSSSAPIRRSRISSSCETMAAWRLPCLDSRSMLAREAPVSAVSLAAKKAETKRQPTTTKKPTECMGPFLCLAHDLVGKPVTTFPDHARSGLTCRFPYQKFPRRRGRIIGLSVASSNYLQQDERNFATLHPPVLLHQHHQRFGSGKPFLREARNILQAAPQA